MNRNERLRASVKSLADAGALPRSDCSLRLMSLLRPMVAAGVVSEKRSGAGRQVIVEDAPAFQAFIRRTFPIEDIAANLPTRVLGVRHFRDTKTYRSDSSDILRVRAFIPGILRKNGYSVNVHGATENHGVFSFRLASEYTLHGRVALVENPTVFDLFERVELALPLVIYGQGRISSRVLGWLANQQDEAFSLLHLPDYDPVGLSEYERIRSRLGSRAQLHFPQNLDDLFYRFGNRKLLGKPRSQKLLVRLRISKMSEVRDVVKLIDSYNAGLEQEALID